MTVQLKIRRYALESPRAVEHRGSCPGCVRARAHNGNVSRMPVTVEERPRLRPVRVRHVCSPAIYEVSRNVSKWAASACDAARESQLRKMRTEPGSHAPQFAPRPARNGNVSIKLS